MIFRKSMALLLLVPLLISACGGTSADPGLVATAIAQTATAGAADQAAQASPTTVNPPTNTPNPSPTPVPPTNTPEPTSAPSSADAWAMNNVASVETGGLSIEVARIVVGEKSALTFEDWSKLDDLLTGWADIDVVGEIIFKVTNNSDKTIDVYLDQGSVQLGSEQVDLTDYMMYTTVGDDVGGEIYPGVTKIGGMWFGIKRTAPADITNIVYRADAPSDPDTYDSLGPDIKIDMDVSQHTWEDIPPELK